VCVKHELRSFCLRLPSFKKLDMAKGISGGDSPYGSDAVGGVDYFFVRVKYEICGVDNLSPLFPKGAHLLCVSGHLQSVANWKR